MHRRMFLKSVLASSAASALGASPLTKALVPGNGDRANRPLKILMLGGRRYVGPAIVAEALARGHEVTLFNRGLTNPHLFRQLEFLYGDRERENGLTALEGDREWDAVVDTWADDPRRVAATSKLLAGRSGHYAYISSIAVYGGELYQRVGLPATANVPAWSNADETKGDEMYYPARKAFGERYVQTYFPERHSLHRCHRIEGLSPQGRLDYAESDPFFTPYWIARLHEGGRFIAPGEPTDTTQWIDVQDVGRFVVQCLDQAYNGPFNLCQTALWGDWLQTIDDLTGNHAEPVWVPAEFLAERDVMPFTDVPGWIPHSDRGKGFFQISNQRAMEHGMQLQPQAATHAEMYEAWLRHHYRTDGQDPRHGAKIGRMETALLAEWDARQGRNAE